MKIFKGKHILVTAGPTREYIDKIRYISNDSSGRMGFAFAHTAHDMGGRVTLISGPVNLKTPKGVKRIDVTTAREMFKITTKEARKADIIIMAAAVADFGVERMQRSKIKKLKGKKTLILKLQKNPDILAMLGRKKRRGQVLIGFALETGNLLKNARRKLREKNCDFIVANDASSIGSKKGQVYLLSQTGSTFKFPEREKEWIARKVLGMTPQMLNK